MSAHSPAERSARVQRARILAAMTEIACESGPRTVTVEQLIARAGVSGITFDVLFGDTQACLIAAVDDAFARAGEQVVQAYELDQPWVERIRAAVQALLRFLEKEPAPARLCVLHALEGGPATLMRLHETTQALSRAIDAGGRTVAKRDVSPSRANEVVGEALGVIRARLTEQDPTPLSDLRDPLTEILVQPYLPSRPTGHVDDTRRE